jgi:hypothetical protein
MMAIMDKRRKEAESKENAKWMGGQGRYDLRTLA